MVGFEEIAEMMYTHIEHGTIEGFLIMRLLYSRGIIDDGVYASWLSQHEDEGWKDL